MSKYQQIKHQAESLNNIKKAPKFLLCSQKVGPIKASNIKEADIHKFKLKSFHYRSMKLLRQNSDDQINSIFLSPSSSNLLLSHVESDISKVPKFLSILNQNKKKQINKQHPYIRSFQQQAKSSQQNDKNKKIMLKETSSTTGTTGKHQNFSPPSVPSFVRQKSPTRSSFANLFNQKITIRSFKILKKIGQGRFGKVYLAKQLKTGVLVALKQIRKKKIIEQHLLTQFIRQLKTQMFLNHPNIIKVYGFFHNKDHFYTIMEYGSDGQLYKKIEKKQAVTEEGASFIAKNLIEAVDHLHSHQIIHRDIKPQNIVLIHGNVKLCDFGWAVHTGVQLRSTFCGTPLYLAPQLLIGEEYNQKVDIWAIGILIYQLLLGYSPFDIHQRTDLFKIVNNEIKYPKNAQLSKQFKRFMSKILEKSPTNRLSCNQLLNLSFIKQYCQLQTCQQFCK